MQENESSHHEKEPQGHPQYSSQNTNRIMGLAAIFISILSVIAVIYQSYLAREENQLMRIQQSATVLPYLDHWYSNVGNEYSLVIENKGLGPALIKDVQFTGVDASTGDSLTFSSSHKLYEFISKQSSFIDSLSNTKSTFQANMLLAPGEKKTYYLFTFGNQDQKSKFREVFNTYFAGYDIVYEDVYGAAWILSSEEMHPIPIDND